eukprot:TRINITY_DN3599_c0_g2_i1.p1 TRINITY_DN3599_c0_g2~~TRINITY_DN3599_c0_g2_i1.p1  ORF type:complete len:259 (+),score=57.58 TRINITY_DN3599_c0_g2_i1:61-837(+)
MAQVQVATVKVEAFRGFVSTLFAQVTEQMCNEFEREVAMLTDDVSLYRTELARCGELLAHQLGREKQLHGILEAIAGNSGTLVANAQDVGKNHEQLHGTKEHMHDMVETLFGHSAMVVNSLGQGVSEAHVQTHNHLAQAKELQNQALTAENELNRIMSILTQPTVAAGQVAPTVARVPSYQMTAPTFPTGGLCGGPGSVAQFHNHLGPSTAQIMTVAKVLPLAQGRSPSTAAPSSPSSFSSPYMQGVASPRSPGAFYA